MKHLSETWPEAYNHVVDDEQIFLGLETQLKKNPTHLNGRKLAKFSVRNYTSHYYSEVLENYYLNRVEKQISPAIPPQTQPRGILHVMTSAYLSGGHTRVVERWIDSAPADEIHSVILIRQRKKKQIPERLKQVVKLKNGRLTRFPYLLPLNQKAKKLRQLALNYEFIVLHQNMTDPVPLMAFGVDAFPRPVVVFNHAGHSFWIGRNATDFVIDIEASQNEITREKRGIAHSMEVNLPYDSQSRPALPEKQLLRKKLQLPADQKLLTSMASAYKYLPVLDYNYTQMLRSVLQQQQNIGIIIIGVASGQTPDWAQLENEFPQRVHLMGILPHEKVAHYLNAADLYLDSFPYSSFTSMLDAISIGQLPVLSLETPIGVPPFLRETPAHIKTLSELIEKTIQLINHPDQAHQLYELLHQKVLKETHAKKFQQQVHEAYRLAKEVKKKGRHFLPIQHKITLFDVVSNELSRKRKQP